MVCFFFVLFWVECGCLRVLGVVVAGFCMRLRFAYRARSASCFVF